MQLSEFDFPFDSSLIAAHPCLPRDHARLLVLQPLDRSLAHRRVDELPDLLQPGDLLVVNNTKVLAARVAGRKRPSGDGGRDPLCEGSWRCDLGSADQGNVSAWTDY